MEDEAYSDMIPVRDKFYFDNSGEDVRQLFAPVEVSDRQMLGEKRAVAQMSRSELEDSYLRLHDEHLILKKHAIKQEDKIKKLATKLSRLLKDKKYCDQDLLAETSLNQAQCVSAKAKNLELEEIIHELQEKMRELEKTNCTLKDKLSLMKQQVFARNLKRGPYINVASRVDTGIHKSPSMTSQLPTARISSARRVQSCTPNYAVQLVEEARNQITHLEDVISKQSCDLENYQQQRESLTGQIQDLEKVHEAEICALREKYILEQKDQADLNCQLINLNRSLNEKKSEVISLQTSAFESEEKFKHLKQVYDTIMQRLNEVNCKHQEEQNKNFDLETEMKKFCVANKRVLELQEQVKCLREELTVLEEANCNLISAPVDQERSLRRKIYRLETASKNDMQDKTNLIEQLTDEKARYSKLEQCYHNLKHEHFDLTSKSDDLQNKMQLFTKSAGVGTKELEEALTYVQCKKGKKDLDFLNQLPKDSSPESHRLKKCMVEHAETCAELEKTRNMLVLQYKINKDYEAELNAAKHSHTCKIREYEAKLDEYAKLLDIKTTRIKRLEKQMKDVAYGTVQQQSCLDISKGNEPEEMLLVKGQNILEIHMHKVMFTTKGLEYMKETQPATFLTWCFYEYKLQSTPVLRENNPVFNATAQYKVKVDDFFLNYLEKESMLVELHQALGLDYQTIATCQICFKELLLGPQSQIHHKAQLIGCDDQTGSEFVFGVLEYWLKLELSLVESLRLFKERTKAVCYLEANTHLSKPMFPTTLKDNTNILHINIIRCTNLVPQCDTNQPSPYCMYKFLDLPDQDTCVVACSNNPEFHDHKAFPVVMDSYLNDYMRNKKLEIFVCDDNDLRQSRYIGKAEIPLLCLAQDKQLHGNFELFDKDCCPRGFIEVSIYWDISYSPICNQTIPKTPISPVTLPKKKIIEPKKYSPKAHKSPMPPQSPKIRKATLRKERRASIKSISSPEPPQSSYPVEPKKKKKSPKRSKSKDPSRASSPTERSVTSPDFSLSQLSERIQEPIEDEIVMIPAHVEPLAQNWMVISIHQLRFMPDAAVLNNPGVEMVYVEYQFLDYLPEDLETPFALPKVNPPNYVTYNFRKVFNFDPNLYPDKRESLAQLLNSDDPDVRKIRFTVVSEPGDECQDLDCEEIGVATIDLKQILATNSDIIDEDLPVLCMDEPYQIAELRVTIQALPLFKAVIEEEFQV